MKRSRLAGAHPVAATIIPAGLISLVRSGYDHARVRAVADQVLASLMGLTAGIVAGQWWAMTERHRLAAATAPPALGERAAGYGVSGRIAGVPEFQPLADGGVWRVTLSGESVGRLVRRDEQEYASGVAGWGLLQLDDLTETQLDAFEAAMSNAAAAQGGSG
jgi:hypothetical protein